MWKKTEKTQNIPTKILEKDTQRLKRLTHSKI
jgi:hypothetical protein